MSYVLITPARNEERHIRLTLDSMAAQTVPPLRWVVVNDGSTDGTDGIVREYTERLPWLDLVQLPHHRERSFAAKVEAFNAGLQRVAALPFDVVGNLDADISFGCDYFEFLMARFSENGKLGVAGTPFEEDGKHYDYRFTNIEHVSGACQLFRRECFDDIGGYVPIKAGGIDWVAVTTARMKGWQTRTFLDRSCTHHRPVGTGASKGRVRAQFRYGQKDYVMGSHPLWQLFRTAYQLTRPPYLVGGVALLAGYSSALLARRKRPISHELVRFYRSEQLARLKAILLGKTA